MKKVSIILGFTFLLIFLSSCLTTLHPIFTEKDLAYDAKLIGVWIAEREGNKERVTINNLATENSVELPGNISNIKEKGYLITYQRDGELPERYIAFLARIGKHLYFDYYPADKKEYDYIDKFFSAHLVKIHTSYRVELLNDGSFELSQLDGSYVNNLIDQKKIRISHETGADGNVVITATTPELQQYLIKYSDDPEAYESKKTIFKK